MPIACVIAQDTHSIKTFLKQSENVVKVDTFINKYHLFIVVLNNPKKQELKKDIDDKWQIYDVLTYDVSQNLMNSSDVLLFIDGDNVTVFEKTVI